MREAARRLERLGIGHGDHLVGHRRVVGGGPEVLAHALDEVRAARAAGVDRALGVRADDPDLASLGVVTRRRDLPQVAPGPGDGAAGPDTRDEVRDTTVRVGPDLRAGRREVRRRAVRVGVLVRLPRAGDLPHEPVGDRVVRVRGVGGDRRRRHDDLGAVRAEHVALVLRDLVRADEHTAVALALRDQREPHAGVPAGRLDDRPAGPQRAGLLGRLDHPQGDPVLDRAAGVHVLDLREDRRVESFCQVRQPDEGGVPDQLGHVLHVAHGPTVAARPRHERVNLSRSPGLELASRDREGAGWAV